MLLVAAATSAGCGSIGPRRMRQDRTDYISSYTESWKRQILLNIVKVRYAEPIFFMDVGDIVAGYSMETGGSVGFSRTLYNGPTLITDNYNPVLSNFSKLEFGASARYTDRPTITYKPMTGVSFRLGVMSALPVRNIMMGLDTGISAKFLFNLGVRSNEFKRFFRHPHVDPSIPITALTVTLAFEYCQAQFKARGGYAANNNVRKNFAAAYSFGMKYRRYPSPNPFLAVERFPQKEVVGHYVPPEADFLKVYEVASEHDKLLLMTLLHTAARRSEVFRLRWEDVDFETREIALRIRKTRDGSMRVDHIPMSDELTERLKRRKTQAVGEHVLTQPNNGTEGKAYTTNRHFPGKLCERAGVKPFGCHGIRGLSATMLARAGEPMKAIQELLRHGNLATTERYLRKSGLARSAVKTFEGRLGQVG